MKTKNTFTNQSGFAVSMIILVVALFAIIIAAMAIAGRGTSTTGSEQSAKVQASTVIQQSSNLKGGFDIMVNAKSIAINSITWDNASTTGLFHPTDGGVPLQVAPKDALVTTSNEWVYKASSGNAVVKLKGIGTDSGADYVVALVDIKQSVCEQINKALYGSTTIPSASDGSSTEWNTAATAIDLSTDSAVDKKPEQCIKTTDNKYVYYKTIYEQ